NARTVAVSPDGSRFISLNDDSDNAEVCLIDGTTGLVTRRFSAPRLGGGWATFTRDGQNLLLFGFKKTMLLDLENGSVDQNISLGFGGEFLNSGRDRWSFSADGRLVTSGGSSTPGRGNATISVMEFATGKVVQSVSPLQNSVVGSVLSPNGKTLA